MSQEQCAKVRHFSQLALLLDGPVTTRSAAVNALSPLGRRCYSGRYSKIRIAEPESPAGCS